MIEDSGWSETTEPEHQHYCARCGGVWGHKDEFCEVGRMPITGYYAYGAELTCPGCQEG